MKEKILAIIQNLLKVKSLVTLTLTGVFSYLAIVGVISGEQFLTIFSVIIAFYFGSQVSKNSETKEKDSTWTQ